jgi:hypothetical protein
MGIETTCSDLADFVGISPRSGVCRDGIPTSRSNEWGQKVDVERPSVRRDDAVCRESCCTRFKLWQQVSKEAA